MRQSSTVSGSRSTKQPSKERGSHLAAAIRNESRQPVHFTPSTPWTKNANNKHKAHKHFKSHHDAIYVVDTEGAQDSNIKFYQTLNMVALSVSKRSQGVHQASHPQKGQSRKQSHKPVIAVQWHMYRRKERQ